MKRGQKRTGKKVKIRKKKNGTPLPGHHTKTGPVAHYIPVQLARSNGVIYVAL